MNDGDVLDTKPRGLVIEKRIFVHGCLRVTPKGREFSRRNVGSKGWGRAEVIELRTA